MKILDVHIFQISITNCFQRSELIGSLIKLLKLVQIQLIPKAWCKSPGYVYSLYGFFTILARLLGMRVVRSCLSFSLGLCLEALRLW